jgi:hypothetical protein
MFLMLVLSLTCSLASSFVSSTYKYPNELPHSLWAAVARHAWFAVNCFIRTYECPLSVIRFKLWCTKSTWTQSCRLWIETGIINCLQCHKLQAGSNLQQDLTFKRHFMSSEASFTITTMHRACCHWTTNSLLNYWYSLNEMPAVSVINNDLPTVCCSEGYTWRSLLQNIRIILLTTEGFSFYRCKCLYYNSWRCSFPCKKDVVDLLDLLKWFLLHCVERNYLDDIL